MRSATPPPKLLRSCLYMVYPGTESLFFGLSLVSLNAAMSILFACRK